MMCGQTIASLARSLVHIICRLLPVTNRLHNLNISIVEV